MQWEKVKLYLKICNVLAGMKVAMLYDEVVKCVNSVALQLFLCIQSLSKLWFQHSLDTVVV